MKKIISLVVAVVIIVAGVVFVPELAHTCDSCDKFFIGVGYKANILDNLTSDEEKIICKSCAEQHHAVSIAFGESLNSFKRELFE
ncbi:MAG: hypothetical protein IKA56_05230 [Clostridia bacterium]|nr:hypothetical protein [Clostridia bacterium]